MKSETYRTPGAGRENELPGGWEGLAAAVIAQACADYRQAQRICRRRPDNIQAAQALRKLERFFTSRWFHTLSDLDGRAVLQWLKEE